MDELHQFAERVAQAEERVARQTELVAELERAGRLEEARQAKEQLAGIAEGLITLRRRLQQLHDESPRRPAIRH